ncbi:unnamed protein product [Microthlaspi erraticum]|uniref:Pentacotripeptide-repeat region of PRORP domain-containing protein n=1 Tax=Microthlaspi erraticum TaxID=1685480 RepID=A0A6D2HV02_9BRAS|nr:unnamed protein product [Microthlaspi erraticum]
METVSLMITMIAGGVSIHEQPEFDRSRQSFCHQIQEKYFIFGVPQPYTSLLDAFRRSGDVEKLMEIWKLMLRERICGTRVTYNTVLDGFAKQGRYIEARDVVSEFGKMGLLPTVMTYNMLMNAYARGGQDSNLPQLLKEMTALT